MTAQNSHIVREFDTPITIEQATPTRDAAAGDSHVLVEDSITHQAGDGMTAGMAPSQETPDIFDNSPQAAVKPNIANEELADAVEVPVEPVATVNTAANTVNINSGVNATVASDPNVQRNMNPNGVVDPDNPNNRVISQHDTINPNGVAGADNVIDNPTNRTAIAPNLDVLPDGSIDVNRDHTLPR